MLDASTLLALLRGKSGAKTAEGAFGDACISVVVMADVTSYFHHLGMPPDLSDQMLRPLPVTLVPANVDLCWEAARLHTAALGTKASLSLGDGSCRAVAKRDSLPVWTADRVPSGS